MIADGIDLRLGDCLAPDGLAALADASVDVTITDPPFDPRTHRAAVELGARREGCRAIAGALPFPPLSLEQIATLAHHFARVTRRWIVVFAAERQLETWAAALETSNARVVRFGIGRRTNPRPQMSGDRPAPAVDHLVIAYAGKTGRMRWNGGGRAASWESPAARFDTGRKTIHPTQKPLKLMRALIEDFTDAGELVLDPFAGSGSTAVACAELGRRLVGWELSPVYYAAAADRIARAALALPFASARP